MVCSKIKSSSCLVKKHLFAIIAIQNRTSQLCITVKRLRCIYLDAKSVWRRRVLSLTTTMSKLVLLEVNRLSCQDWRLQQVLIGMQETLYSPFFTVLLEIYYVGETVQRIPKSNQSNLSPAHWVLITNEEMHRERMVLLVIINSMRLWHITAPSTIVLVQLKLECRFRVKLWSNQCFKCTFAYM